MASTAAAAKKESKDVKMYTFAWEGKDKSGKVVKGEMRRMGRELVRGALGSLLGGKRK